jgi:hypothetical protein
MDALIVLLAACASPPPAPPPAEPCPPPPAVAAATPFEEQLLGPVLASVREGVVPAPEGLGLCAGAPPECARFIGADGGELPPGPWYLKAELDPPDLGLWKVTFTLKCTVTPPDGGAPFDRTESRTMEVPHIPKQPTSLTPLVAFESPAPGGAEDCTWTLESPHPDGPKVRSGSYSVPGA